MHKPEIDPNLTIGMLRRAQLNPERKALIFEDVTYTYGDFAQLVRRQAKMLQDSGVCVWGIEWHLSALISLHFSKPCSPPMLLALFLYL